MSKYCFHSSFNLITYEYKCGEESNEFKPNIWTNYWPEFEPIKEYLVMIENVDKPKLILWYRWENSKVKQDNEETKYRYDGYDLLPDSNYVVSHFPRRCFI